MQQVIFFLICLFGTLKPIEGGKVLMYMAVSTKSHKNVWKPLAFSLAERGHEVTMVTAFREPENSCPKNYIEIVIEYDPSNLVARVAKEVVEPVDNNIYRCEMCF